jgi:hypothetical protein
MYADLAQFAVEGIGLNFFDFLRLHIRNFLFFSQSPIFFSIPSSDFSILLFPIFVSTLLFMDLHNMLNLFMDKMTLYYLMQNYDVMKRDLVPPGILFLYLMSQKFLHKVHYFLTTAYSCSTIFFLIQ